MPVFLRLIDAISQGGVTMKSNYEALAILVAALLVGAAVQSIVRQQAAILGLTTVEMSLLGAAAGAVVTRGLDPRG